MKETYLDEIRGSPRRLSSFILNSPVQRLSPAVSSWTKPRRPATSGTSPATQCVTGLFLYPVRIVSTPGDIHSRIPLFDQLIVLADNR